jgi:hypothetical protein
MTPNGAVTTNFENGLRVVQPMTLITLGLSGAGDDAPDDRGHNSESCRLPRRFSNSGMVKDQVQGEKAQAQNRIMEEPEIKRCPFCGSGAKLEEVESEDGYRFDVYCTNVQYCGGTTSRCRSAAKAIEFWNRRFPG